MKNADLTKRIGLTLGKYAPLHRGHQYIIERMLAENDEAVVIIYDTDITPIPLPVRAAWIRELYPAVRVIEAWDGPIPPGWAEDEHGWTGRSVQQQHEERDQDPTHKPQSQVRCRTEADGAGAGTAFVAMETVWPEITPGIAGTDDVDLGGAGSDGVSLYDADSDDASLNGTGTDGAEIRAYEKSEEEYILGLLLAEGLARKAGDAVITDITGFYSSEYYGAHVAEALGCADVRIDEARKTFPVSSRLIREDTYGNRRFVDPRVYQDLIVKAVFLGAMSTGKSALAEALAKRHGTSFAREYGRDYWTEFHRERRIGLEEFDIIAKRHQEIEEEAFHEANRVCFVDTNAITTYVYSLDYHGKATEYLTRAAIGNAMRYDLFFLCEDDIPYDDTWDRSGDAKRHVFHKQVVADLEIRRIPYIRLSGSLEERMRKVEETLSVYEPYSNYFGGNGIIEKTKRKDISTKK